MESSIIRRGRGDLLCVLSLLTVGCAAAFAGAVFLVLFMMVDAGYSGDWSRIGAISKENEAQLQQVGAGGTCRHRALRRAGQLWR